MGTTHTCSAEDFSLVTLQEESEDAVINTIQSVLPRLNSTMDSRVGGLHESFAEVSELLYDVISNVYQLNRTKSGLNKFMEAIGEISSGYALACSSPPEVRPGVDDIPRLMNEFRVAFDEQIHFRFVSYVDKCCACMIVLVPKKKMYVNVDKLAVWSGKTVLALPVASPLA